MRRRLSRDRLPAGGIARHDGFYSHSMVPGGFDVTS